LITLAIPKGRIFHDVLPLLQAAGVELFESPDLSRKLIIETKNPELRLLIVRASDVPTYVRFGAADMGIVGSDVLFETATDGLYQPVDLNTGVCRLSLAVPKEVDYYSLINRGIKLRVATKYPKQALEYFALKGIQVDIIKLYGSMELSPLVGLSDVIVDLVSTGQTLKANGLNEIEVIKDITSRLIVNKASFKMKNDILGKFITTLSSARKG
jgi:ATP phosphoribosyltransferase